MDALEVRALITELLKSLATQYGYLGMLVISFLGAASIFFPIPYTSILLFLAMESDLNPYLLALSAGVGAGLGEITGYYLGRFGRRLIGEERKRKLRALYQVIGEKGLIAVFIFALTPLPDDLLFIPLGLLGYPLLPVLLVCIAGKILMSLIITLFGRYSKGFINAYIGDSGLYSTLVAVALTVIVTALVLKIDWERVLLKTGKEKR